MTVFRIALLLVFVMLLGCMAEENGKNSQQIRNSGTKSPRPIETPPGRIRLAAIYPTSGRYEASGRECLNGVGMAVDRVNRGGGVLGRKLFMVPYPTRSDVESTQAEARRAVAEGAVVLLGSNASLLSETVAQVAEEHEVVMITNVSTATNLTWNRPFVFRTCYSNDLVARLMARYVWTGLKCRKVAVLQEVARPYSKDLGDRFSHHFMELIQARGVGEIRTWQYISMESDFTQFLQEIRTFGAGVLFVPSSFDDATLVAIQVRAMGIPITMVGGDSWSNARLFNRGGPGRPAYHSEYWDPRPDNAFYLAFRQRYGTTSRGGRAALANDAVLAVVQALYSMGRPLVPPDLVAPGLIETRRRLREHLAGVKVTGATGLISFDRQGDARKPCYVFKVDGTSRTLTTILE